MKPNTQDRKLIAAQKAFDNGDDTRTSQLCRELLRLNPSNGPVLGLLADAAFRQGDFERALTFARRAIAVGHQPAEQTLGCTLSKTGALDEAVVALRRCHERNPENAQFEYNLSMVELASGLWSDGLHHFEARWNIRTPPAYVRPWSSKWRGEDVRGKRVFVFAEQGYGDTIQFSRFVPLLVARGAEVILAIQSELFRLFSGSLPVQILKPGDKVPAWDYHVPIMSIPLALGTPTEQVPRPLTFGVPSAVSGVEGSRRRIGVCWAGNRRDSEDRFRSLSSVVLDELLSLLAGSDVYSLQLGGDAELASCRSGTMVVPIGDKVRDFQDTADIIRSLDLVISVDTSIAHLAASLGKSVWLLLWTACDWRWSRDKETTFWYPSMRLFRQKDRGDWSIPLKRVAMALASDLHFEKTSNVAATDESSGTS